MNGGDQASCGVQVSCHREIFVFCCVCPIETLAFAGIEISVNMQVKPEHCEDFENVWKKRDTHLKEFSGFVRFALLRCDDAGEYRSESFWENRAAFDNWRKSEQASQKVDNRCVQHKCLHAPP